MTNWEQHFRQMRPDQYGVSHYPSRSDFGMIGNAYSVAELIDLVAAKDVAVSNIEKLLGEVQGKPFDTSIVSSHLSILKNRYQSARNAAETAITLARLNFLVPNTMIPADAEYKGILAALNPKWESHTWSQGDGSLEDLQNTLTTMGATGITASPTPQPKGGTDFNLNQLQTASMLTTMAEGAAQGGGKLLGSGVSGVFGQLDMATLAKIGVVAALGMIFLPKLLAMGPARLLIR